MRSVRTILNAKLVALAVSCVCVTGSNSQVLSDNEIEDIETLEWLRDAEYIDDDEYEQWDEMFVDSSGEMISPDTFSSFGETESPGATDHRNPLIRFIHGVHHRVDEAHPYRQTYRLKIGRDPNFAADANLESDADGRLACRRRSLIARLGKSAVKLGDIDPKYCGGLVAGNHDIYLKDKPSNRSILYPSRSRFNGVQLETAVSNTQLSAFASYDRDTLLSSAAFGAQVGWTLGKLFRTGVSALAGRLRNTGTGGSRNVGAAGLEAGLKSNSIFGDVQICIDSYRNPALMFEVRGNRNSPKLNVWHYGRKFFNPFASGRANSDKCEVSVPEIGLTYRARQADETGILIENRLKFTRSDMTSLAANWWRTGDIEKLRIRASSTVRLSETDESRLVLLTGDDDLAAEGHQIHSARCTLSGVVQPLGRQCICALSTYIRCSNDGKTDKTARSAELRVRDKLDNWDIDLRVRWFDPNHSKHGDEYLYVSICNDISVAEMIRISVLGSTKLGSNRTLSGDSILRVQTEVAM